MKKTLFILLLTGLISILAACSPSGAEPDESGELLIVQIDESGGMRFEPSDIVLTAGQRVRLILENQGEKDHEFMVGRNVIRTDDGAPNGFEVDFFDGIEDMVDTTLGEGAMLMIDGETVAMGGMGMGEEEMDMEEGEEMDMGEGEEMDMAEDGEHSDDGEHGMDHMGFMVMNNAGSGRTIIEFMVPEDKVGEWETACFEDDGAHYEDGMHGTLTVVEP